MAPEIVYIVPGVAESNLLAANPLGNPNYVQFPNISGFLLGTFGGLRLADDGVSPGPPDGVACVTGGTLLPYVVFPTIQLQSTQAAANYSLFTWAWDWRQTIFTAGDALAALIAASIPQGQQCSIVAHSAGGMVARRAWYTLNQTGQAGLIRRIVTIGTPHYGTYYAAQVWSGGQGFIGYLHDWNQWAGQTILGISLVTGYVNWSLNDIITLTQTWPALYELLPIIGAPDASGDPNRAQLFDAANWTTGPAPSQAWLDHAVNVYQPWALSSASFPPQNVMVCIGGVSHLTGSTLEAPSQLGTAGAFGATTQGDSVVTYASATPAGYAAIQTYGPHDSQYPDAVNDGQIIAWINLPVSPSPPPPPVEVYASTITVGLPPPVPPSPQTGSTVYGPFGGSFMGGGDC